MHKRGQYFIIFEKPGNLPEKLKAFYKLQLLDNLIIFVEILLRFLITHVYGKEFGICFILFRSCVICRNKKELVSMHSQKPCLSKTYLLVRRLSRFQIIFSEVIK